MKAEQQTQSLKSQEKHVKEVLPIKQMNQEQYIPRVRHMYIQEQNIYGRFIPYLLLKDQLHSQIDSSGSTVLNHMCSHNSFYLQLYLNSISQDDPILNRPSRMGHTPLAVAGLYCDPQNLQLLKKKGAKDNGQVDYWAIQGGRWQNWSGKVDINQKQLIHWAAYNDMPEVLQQFDRNGANMQQVDNSTYTPLDIAVINKSYASVKYLAQLGFRPKRQLLLSCDSISIKKLFQKLEEKQTSLKCKRSISILLIPFFWLLIYQLYFPNWVLFCIIVLLWVYLLLRKVNPQQVMNGRRNTMFLSETLNNYIKMGRNHTSYLMFNLLQGIIGILCLCMCQIASYLDGIMYWIVMGISCCYLGNTFLIIYTICKNLTRSQMLYSHKWPHLWQDIYFVPQRRMLFRKYRNPFDEGFLKNLNSYLV